MLQYNKVLLLFTKWIACLFLVRYINFKYEVPIHIVLGIISIFFYLNMKSKDFSFLPILKKSNNFNGLIQIILLIILFEVISYNIFFVHNFDKIKIYFEGIIIPIIAFQLFNCAIEEILFRVILIDEVNNKYRNKNYKIIISSIIFGLYHIILVNDTTNIYMITSFFIGTFMAGVGFAYIYIYSKNYIYVVIIHTVYNVIQNCITLQFNTVNMDNNLVFVLHMYMGIIFIISGILYKKLNIKKETIVK